MTDFEDIRDRFPGCSGPWARFDAPAGSQTLDTVIEAMAEFQRSGAMSNSHGLFEMSDACDELVENTRSSVARLLGAPSNEIVFGQSATALILHLTRSITNTLGADDEIICTQLDHDANVSPWMMACRDSGAKLRMAQIETDQARLPVEAVSSLITPKTRWIAITGASNAVGTIPDLAAVCAVAREADVRVLIDGVHLTPHRKVDLEAIGCDAYVTSAYKWYGPHVACMWMSPSLLADLPPYRIRPAPEHGADSWQLGTSSFEGIAGLGAAAEFLTSVGMENIHDHEMNIFAQLLEGLQAMGHVETFGPDDLLDRTPTVAFRVSGQTPDETAEHLARHKVAVWSGHYYALEIMAALGLAESGGAVRAGVSVYTTGGEVERLLSAVRELA